MPNNSVKSPGSTGKSTTPAGLDDFLRNNHPQEVVESLDEMFFGWLYDDSSSDYYKRNELITHYRELRDILSSQEGGSK